MSQVKRLNTLSRLIKNAIEWNNKIAAPLIAGTQLNLV